MAPRKEKGEKSAKVSSEDGAAMILAYLRQQNRPYSAIDISANLHNKVTKGYTVKALKELHDRKEIEGRTAGKQIVYHALQDPVEDASPEQLAAMDKEIEELKSTIAEVKAQERSLKSDVATLTSRVSTTDLRTNVSDLEAEKQRLVALLAPLKNGAPQREVSEEELARVNREWKTWQNHVTLRKRICRGMWERCTEILPDGIRTREEMWESLGLDGKL